MEITYTILLILHISAGSTALVTGGLAIGTRKGKKPHILTGSIYFWTMIAVGTTALAMSFWTNNQFLLGTSVFTLYMVFTGRRLIRRRKGEGWWAGTGDHLAMAGAFLGGAYLTILGVGPMLHGIWEMNIVSAVFGLTTLSFVGRDGLTLIRGKWFDRKENLLLHIGRMGGGYIATFTAFLVTNASMDPEWLLWLAPTAIGSPLIAIGSARWRKKLNPKGKAARRRTQTIPPAEG